MFTRTLKILSLGALALLITDLGIDDWNRKEQGKYCIIGRNLYAVADMEKSYDDLVKAVSTGDSFWIKDLRSTGKAALWPRGAIGFVIGGEFSFKAGARYSKVRLAGGPPSPDSVSGDTFWIKTAWLIQQR